MEQKKKIKIAIIILAILLGLSILALGGTLVYNKLANNTPTTVTVPDNLITPDEDTTKPDSSENNSQAPDSSDTQTPRSSANASSSAVPTQSTTAEAKKAATIELYNKQPEENTPFAVGNMFPGDVETKYFRVRVSYHDKITVHYKATVRPGYEKLAEVLKVRVNLLSTGETMYDGLMRDMPESLTHKLASKKSTTDELYYEITAYLDTSVGNDYQNKDLIADFKWWVEETGNLDASPQTGDTSNILLWAALAAGSLSMIIILLKTRRRKEDEENV
ncbi:LPXTG cell wall anchor domain-containing protein [Yeguia hominis]|uniref:LPXTG cell wall anchor domain-containing protein n=1 Tax=Yeguia hominis TaxID=2763662 RepID=A0A926DAD9_9FIRM|nr:LPXTG cell wall anchor domain-containing protein [Yeguia hominis]